MRLELQADCFAGVWAKHADQTKHILEQGDVERRCAPPRRSGDDTIQKRARGYVVPESFTHGTRRGAHRLVQARAGERLDSGCDTFAAGS